MELKDTNQQATKDGETEDAPLDGSASKHLLEPPVGHEPIPSEHTFKLRLSNLPYFFHTGALKKFLADKVAGHMVVRKAEKSREGFIGFRSQRDLDAAKACLHGLLLKGSAIVAEQVESDDRARGERLLESDNKKPKLERSQDSQAALAAASSTEELIQDQVTPLWRLSYERQLVLKSRKARKVLDRLYTSLAEAWKESSRVPHLNALLDGRARAHISAMLPSPVVDGYRNKCEFAIGQDLQTGQAVIGFSLGSYREGVASPLACRHVSEVMKELLLSLQAFVRSSGEPPYDRVTKCGFWRLIVLRENILGQCMVLFQFHGADLAAPFRDALLAYCQSEARIASAHYQLTESKSFAIDPATPFTLFHGTPCLNEQLCGLQFLVSPHAFFQVNRRAAETLYDLIRGLATPRPCTESGSNKRRILLDLCCGTGTIGLALAAHFDLVVGIDSVASAIEDATVNAKLNGISHARHLCGKLEDKLPSLMQSVQQAEDLQAAAEWTVILDPPRAGTHSSVIRSIRGLSLISRVIYVSCAPELAAKDFLDLCRPISKRYPNAPFTVDSAAAVDLFPHTEHYELVLALSRQASE